MYLCKYITQVNASRKFGIRILLPQRVIAFLKTWSSFATSDHRSKTFDSLPEEVIALRIKWSSSETLDCFWEYLITSWNKWSTLETRDRLAKHMIAFWNMRSPSGGCDRKTWSSSRKCGCLADDVVVFRNTWLPSRINDRPPNVVALLNVWLIALLNT